MTSVPKPKSNRRSISVVPPVSELRSILKCPPTASNSQNSTSRWSRFTRRVASIMKPKKNSSKSASSNSRPLSSQNQKSVSFGDNYEYFSPISSVSECRISLPNHLPSGFSSLPSAVILGFSQFLCWHELLHCRSISRYYYFHFSHEDAFKFSSVFDDSHCFAHQRMQFGGPAKFPRLSHSHSSADENSISGPSEVDQPDSHAFSHVSVDQILFSIPFLRSLNLSNYSLNSAMILSLSRFPLLQHLNISNCRPPSCQPVNKILPAIRGLRILSLDLSSTILYFPDHFSEIAHFPHLLSLQIARSRVQSDCLKYLPQLPAIRILNLCNNSSLGDNSLIPLEFATSLSSLFLDDCHLSLDSIRHILPYMTSLIHLSFSLLANSGDDSFFEFLVETHPNLEMFHLNRLLVFHQALNEPSGLTDLTLEYLGRLTKLKQLKFQSIQFSPAGLTKLFSSLTNLKRLAFTLEEESHISYESTFKSISSLSQLESLYLFTANRVSDSEFSEIMKNNSLRYANTRVWHSVTAESQMLWTRRLGISHYSDYEFGQYEKFHQYWLFPANYSARWPLERLRDWKQICQENEETQQANKFKPEYEMTKSNKENRDENEFSLDNSASKSNSGHANEPNEEMKNEKHQIKLQNQEHLSSGEQHQSGLVVRSSHQSQSDSAHSSIDSHDLPSTYSPRNPTAQSPRSTNRIQNQSHTQNQNHTQSQSHINSDSDTSDLLAAVLNSTLHGTPIPTRKQFLADQINAIEEFSLDSSKAVHTQKPTDNNTSQGKSIIEFSADAFSRVDANSPPLVENDHSKDKKETAADTACSSTSVARLESAHSDEELDASFEIRFHDEHN